MLLAHWGAIEGVKFAFPKMLQYTTLMSFRL
jgi:hypothetical protein